MEFTVERMHESHFEELVLLFQEFALFEKLPERMTNSVELMMQEKEFINGFVVKNKLNEIVGYATFFFAYYTWTGKSTYMDDLYVSQQYRGKGLGTVLINKVIAVAKETNCKKLRWQVSNWNQPAISFYESLGATIDKVEMNCNLEL